VFTRASHWSLLSQMNPVYTFPPLLPSIHFNIILPATPNGLFASGFATLFFLAFFVSHTRYMLRPSHPPSFDHRNNIW